MSESEARIRLRSIAETNGHANTTLFVEQHIGEIKKLGGGTWNDRIAQKHVLISLEAALLPELRD